jgi:hypothetical protein
VIRRRVLDSQKLRSKLEEARGPQDPAAGVKRKSAGAGNDKGIGDASNIDMPGPEDEDIFSSVPVSDEE